MQVSPLERTRGVIKQCAQLFFGLPRPLDPGRAGVALVRWPSPLAALARPFEGGRASGPLKNLEVQGGTIGATGEWQDTLRAIISGALAHWGPQSVFSAYSSVRDRCGCGLDLGGSAKFSPQRAWSNLALAAQEGTPVTTSGEWTG